MFSNRKLIHRITVVISALLAIVMIVTMFSGIISIIA